MKVKLEHFCFLCPKQKMYERNSTNMLKNRILLNHSIMMNILGFYLNLKVYAKNTSAKECHFVAILMD